VNTPYPVIRIWADLIQYTCWHNSWSGVKQIKAQMELLHTEFLRIFTIDPRTGAIFTNGSLDREEVSSYALQVEAVDNPNSSL